MIKSSVVILSPFSDDTLRSAKRLTYSAIITMPPSMLVMFERYFCV